MPLGGITTGANKDAQIGNILGERVIGQGNEKAKTTTTATSGGRSSSDTKMRRWQIFRYDHLAYGVTGGDGQNAFTTEYKS